MTAIARLRADLRSRTHERCGSGCVSSSPFHDGVAQPFRNRKKDADRRRHWANSAADHHGNEHSLIFEQREGTPDFLDDGRTFDDIVSAEDPGPTLGVILAMLRFSLDPAMWRLLMRW